MAVSLVQGKTVDSTGTSVAFASFTPSAANLMTCASKAGATGNTMGCSDGTNTWNNIDIANTADGSDELASFYAANVSGSAVTVTITCTVAGHSTRGILEEYSGVATASPLNDQGTGGQNTGQTSGTVTTNGTTTLTGDLVVAWHAPVAASTVTPGSGYAQGNVVPAAGTTRLASEWKAATAGGSQSAAASWASSQWMGNIATFAAAAASGALPPGARAIPPGAAAIVASQAYVKLGSDLWLLSQPNPKMPPGVPLVTAAAIPPHQGDNWTFTRSLNRDFDTVPAKQPPGAQVVTPGATQQAGPTFAPGSAIAVVSSPIPPQPPGVISIDPGARQIAGPTFAPGSLIEVVSTAIPPMPPGKQVVTGAALAPHAGDNWTFVASLYTGTYAQPPGAQVVTAAAISPHAGDNWSFRISAYPGMAVVTPPSGVQLLTAAAVSPHAGDNWTVALSLNRGFDTVPTKQPPGQQAVCPIAVPPHAGDNWTYTQSFFPGFATPLPIPTGLQVVIRLVASVAADATWFQVLDVAAASQSPVGQQLVVGVPAYVQTEKSWRQSLDLALYAQPPVGDQLVLSPSPVRSPDWSINPSLFPGMAGPVALPSGQIAIVAPQKPKNAGDNYTFAPVSPVETLAQQPSPPPGKQISNYALVWQQRPDYARVVQSPIALFSSPRRDLVYAVGAPQAKWHTSEPQPKWRTDPPAAKWQTAEPQE